MVYSAAELRPVPGAASMDWLATPAQCLAEGTVGAVFHTDSVSLPRHGPTSTGSRATSGYVLACQWQRISQEEVFVGRCGDVGEEFGSAVVAARLVHDLMRLSLLMDHGYPPNSNWLGSA
jgi:hypothetical protein